MSYMIRKVLFYELKVKIRGSKKTLNMNNVFSLFDKKVKKLKSHMEGGFTVYSINLISGDNPITLDVIDYNNDFAFCRIGRKKDLNSYHKRNEKDLSIEKIRLDSEQYLEVFTYFLIDFNYGIISHVYSMSAPNIKNFEYFFEKMSVLIKGRIKKKVIAEIISIPNDDAIKMLRDVTYFSYIEAKFSIPAKELFEKNAIKLLRNKHSKLADLDSKNVTIVIGSSGNNQKNLKEFKETAEELYAIRNDGALVKLNIKANFNGGRSENVNLLDEKFNRQVSIRYEAGSSYIPIGNIKTEIEYIYKHLKTDLLKRIGYRVTQIG